MAIIHQFDKRSGITYAYESKSCWDKEKKQSRSKRHLIGRVDDETGEIIPTDGRNRNAAEKSAPVVAHKSAGATYLLDRLAMRIGLVDDPKRCFGNQAKQIQSLAEYLTLEPDSTMYRFDHWESLPEHPYGQPISSQRISELFADIQPEQIKKLFRLQGKRRVESEYWAYDSTSISSYSRGLKKIKRGRNKESDPLAQLNLLLVCGEKSGLPFYYRKLAGNITDVKTVQRLLADLDVLDIKKAKLVMDRGFYNKANVDAMMGVHLKFLAGVRTGLKFVRTALDAHMDEIKSFQNYDDNFGVYGITVRTSWSYEQVRPYKGDIMTESRRVYLQLYCNNTKRAEDEHILDQRLGELYRELTGGQWIEAHAKDYERFFNIKETPKRGRQVTLNDSAIQDAKRYCGYWTLLANEEMDAQQALYTYRAKDVIEKAFGNIKERLSGRRLLVSSE